MIDTERHAEDGVPAICIPYKFALHIQREIQELEASRLSPQAEEPLRVAHARKQGAADGFQDGWHAALTRISDGDGVNSLRELIPSPPAAHCATCGHVIFDDGDIRCVDCAAGISPSGEPRLKSEKI